MPWPNEDGDLESGGVQATWVDRMESPPEACTESVSRTRPWVEVCGSRGDFQGFPMRAQALCGADTRGEPPDLCFTASQVTGDLESHISPVAGSCAASLVQVFRITRRKGSIEDSTSTEQNESRLSFSS